MKKFLLSTAFFALTFVGAQAQNQVKKVDSATPATIEQKAATPESAQPVSNTEKPADAVQNAQPDPNSTAQPATTPAAAPDAAKKD